MNFDKHNAQKQHFMDFEIVKKKPVMFSEKNLYIKTFANYKEKI